MKKIYSAHGIAGIYKGQVVTFCREAVGYGVYFLAYEKLIQREMARKGIPRHQIQPANAVLYGAAAGYAVCLIFMLNLAYTYPSAFSALGFYIPNRYDQVSDANRRLHPFNRAEIHFHSRLRP
jgi:hypothetical protein